MAAVDGKAAFASIGAGVYWGVSMRSLSGWYRGDFAGLFAAAGFASSSTAATCINQGVIIGIAVLLTVFARRLRGVRPVRAIACAGLAANCVLALCMLVPQFGVLLSGSPAAVAAMMGLRGAGMAGCMMLWGLRFASLEKDEAARSVALVCVIGFLVYYLTLLIAPLLSVAFDSVCFAVSLACFLLAGCPIRRTPRDFRREAVPKVALFYGSRAVIGFCLGLSNVFLLTMGTPVVSIPLVAVGLTLVAGCLVWLLRGNDDGMRLLPLLPFIATGLFLLPCSLQGGSVVFGEIATVLVWLCWIMLSSFQLSELKGAFGMDEATLSFSEKGVIMGAWLAGSWVADAMMSFLPAGMLTDLNGYLSVAFVYGMVVYAAASLWNLVYSRKRQQMIDELSRPEQERRDVLYDGIAQRYGLSGREREVLALLAEGHTRRYIQDALAISDGTAKAHTAHVYQKLGVHKREELLMLVDGAKRGEA